MTVGIVGAGQLGRMLALAGYPLGLNFLCLDPARDAPASRVAPVLHGSFSDAVLLRRLARSCEVVTFDWENVPVASLARIARLQRTRICPPLAALAAGQDRVAEKQLFERLAIPTTRWHAVGSRAEPVRIMELLEGRLMAEDGQRREDGRVDALDTDDDGGAVSRFLHDDAADLLEQGFPVGQPEQRVVAAAQGAQGTAGPLEFLLT